MNIHSERMKKGIEVYNDNVNIIQTRLSNSVEY